MTRHRPQPVKQYPPNLTPFPLNAFPPVMGGAIHDVWARTKAPIPLIASSVLSASALACQRRYEVRLPFGAISPLSLFMLLVANSGERKSAADALVYSVIRQIEKEHRIEFEEQREIHRQKIASWSAVDKALQQNILRADGERLLELQAALEGHHSRKPVEPSERRYILDDTTPAAIIGSLRKSHSATMVSNDGRTMLMGRALSDLSLINRAWDRAVLRVDRAGADAIVLDDYALSLWIMAQPGVLDEFMTHDRGRVSRETGFLARCLIALPDSTQGHRYFDPLAFQPEAGLREFHQRLEDALNADAVRQIIEPDPAATESWTRFHNLVEQDLLPGQYLSDLTDFASKAPENAARIAAIFHVMAGRSGPLQVDHMQHACLLAGWYLQEAKRLFGAPLISQEQIDAEALATWLQSRIRWPHPFVDLSKAYVYHHAPYALRERVRLNPALWILGSQGRISYYMVGRKTIVRYHGRIAI